VQHGVAIIFPQVVPQTVERCPPDQTGHFPLKQLEPAASFQPVEWAKDSCPILSEVQALLLEKQMEPLSKVRILLAHPCRDSAWKPYPPGGSKLLR
jgi:hypothetical protein